MQSKMNVQKSFNRGGGRENIERIEEEISVRKSTVRNRYSKKEAYGYARKEKTARSRPRGRIADAAAIAT